jgi:hypothetical protein
MVLAGPVITVIVGPVVHLRDKRVLLMGCPDSWPRIRRRHGLAGVPKPRTKQLLR